MSKIVNITSKEDKDQKLQDIANSLQELKDVMAEVIEAYEEDNADSRKMDTLTEALDALEDAYEAGKLRAIGVSNFYPNILTNFCETVKIGPMVNQVELHPFFAQENALETMRHYGVVPEAWAPLGGGRYAPFENKTLLKIAAVHGKAVSQVMLRWNVQRGVVVIPKSTHRERIVQNLDIWDFSLTEEEMGQISALDLGYAGTAVKHFDPDFVRMCVTRKIHD